MEKISALHQSLGEDERSQMLATQFVMVLVLQLEDAGNVDEQRRSLPSSQPSTPGWLA